MTTESNRWYYDPENLTSPARRLPWGIADQCNMSPPYLERESAEAARLSRLAALPRNPAALPASAWFPILEDAARRDPRLAALLGPLEAWREAEGLPDHPSGCGGDRGIYVRSGASTVVMMENDPEEEYLNLPTPENYWMQLEREDEQGMVSLLRAVMLEGGEFIVTVETPDEFTSVSKARPTAPAVPTVVVHVTEAGFLEAVCADVEVRVILVDYCATQDHPAAVTAPDGDLALINSVRLMAFPDRVAEYVEVAGLPAVAEARA